VNIHLHRCFSRFFAALTFLLTGMNAAAQSNIVPLPVLPAGPVDMRVAYVINPRLPRMDATQLQRLLAATRTTVLEHFGVELRFGPVRKLAIEPLFDRIPARRQANALAQIYDFKTNQGDPVRLARAFGKGLRDAGEPLESMIAYSRAYTGELKEHSFEALGVALSRLQIERIERWKSIKALDGGPAIDAAPYNEFSMWLALGMTDMPYELVLTNQVIASIEYIDPAVHAAIRGGYDNGVTTTSPSSRFKTMSVWSTFAYTTEDPWVRQMRDGESYTADEAARLAGIGAAHEIGHQLFHLTHPFGQDACVMNPVSMFAYRAWVAKLSPAACPFGSSPAMTPGAYKSWTISTTSTPASACGPTPAGAC